MKPSLFAALFATVLLFHPLSGATQQSPLPAPVEGIDSVFSVRSGRDNDHRDLVAFAEFRKHFEPVTVGKVEVKNDQIEGRALQGF